MICALVAVLAFLAGCEWMVQMKRRARRKADEVLAQFNGTGSAE